MNIKLPMLAAALAAAAVSGCGKPQDDAFGRRVRAYLLEHPEVVEEAIAKLQEKKRAASGQAAAAALASLRQQIERDPRDLVLNPNGKVTVVEFFDYRCGYCKTAAPEVLRIARENADVRFVLKEMPIFGGISDTAAKVALTPAGKDKGAELYGALMGEQSLDEAALDRHLAAQGLDPAAVRKAAQAPEIAKQIADIRALANALHIEGTPAFIVGDRMIAGADMQALHAAITDARAGKLQRPG